MLSVTAAATCIALLATDTLRLAIHNMLKQLIQALINRVPRTELKHNNDTYVLVVNPRSLWSTLTINNKEVIRGYTNLVSRRLRILTAKGVILK